MSNKNTEFLRAITGPKIEYNGSPVTRYSTWSIGGGLKVDENPFFNKLNLSIDDQHIIDLIDAHGGGGGDTSDWAMHPAVQNVEMDGKLITSLGEPLNLSDAATKGYVDAAVSGSGGGDASDWAMHPAVQNVGMDGKRITNMAEPVLPSDAATKAYVDASSGGGGGGISDRIQHVTNGGGTNYVSAVRTYTNPSTGVSYCRTYVYEYDGNFEYDSYTHLSRRPEGQRYELRLDLQPDSLIFEANQDTTYGEKIFRFKNAPVEIEAPVSASHAATKGYVDTAVSGATGGPWSSIAATSNIDANSFRMTNLGSPIAAADAATKAYVDSKDISGWAGYPALFNINANSKRITSVAEPLNLGDAATKGYVDGIAGLAASIAEGELPLTIDNTNSINITSSAAGPLRYTRVGRTVTLSGLIQLTADNAGAATAAFTGIDGAAAPATNNTWRGIISDQTSGQTKNLNIMVYSANNAFRYTVVGAEAGASYRLSFVMQYRSAA